FISAGADKGFFAAPFYQLHFLVALGAAGVACTRDGLPVAAFPVLADQKPAVLAVYRQHPFAAAGTFGISQIVMTELSCCSTDFSDQIPGITFDRLDKRSFF